MCGLAGVFLCNCGKVEPHLVKIMTKALAHRGPDDFGFFCLDSVGLGHARLSIIDVAGGHQPMNSLDGRATIAFNGEIYNYLELREQLLKAEVKFRTVSDTEVILAGYQIYGPAWFSKLNGQFAIAIYDHQSKTLHLARDTCGEKPLYILTDSKLLAFASEVKSLIALAKECGLPLTLDRDAISDYFSLNYVPSGRTFINSIQALQPGTHAEIKNGAVTAVTPLAIEKINLEGRSLEDLVLEATRIRLRSDVSLGLFLSGGLDSTIIAWAATKLGARPNAFIADFLEPGFSEAEQAKKTCRELGLSNTVVPISVTPKNVRDIVDSLVFHGDTPLADSSSLPVYLLSQATAKSVKVVLTGDGGDELFAGYVTYTATNLASKIPPQLRRILSKLAWIISMFPYSNGKVGRLEKLHRFLRGLSVKPGIAHFMWNGMFKSSEKHSLFSPEFFTGPKRLNLLEDTFEKLAVKHRIDPLNPSLKSLMNADLKEYLCNDVLVKVDRMTMAHGLEARPVFLDPRIIEYSNQLNEIELTSGNMGKLPLRTLIRRNIPGYPVLAKKQGFSIPIHRWFRTVFRDLMEETIAHEAKQDLPVFRMQYLQRLWQDHLQGKRQIGFELWGIMIAIRWLDRFKIAR